MLRWITLALLLSIAGAAGGCYGAARPAPRKAELPPLVDGATLELDVARQEYFSESRGRYVSDKLISGMSYGNIPLTYHEARSLADPTWTEKLAEYDALVKRCRRANVPRYLGFTGVALGALAYTSGGAVFQENGRLQATVGIGLLGFGLASYAAGYLLLGGQACGEAAVEYRRLHLGAAGESKIYRDEVIRELAHIAENFNKRMARRAHKDDRGED